MYIQVHSSNFDTTMRYLLLLYVALICPATHCTAQMFKTKFVIEDAVGNRDSVWIGFDTLANYTFNPSFGEEDIDTPFGPVLDVRVTHASTWANETYETILLSKTIIGWCELYGNINCYLPEAIPMFIYAAYPPVTVSWDRSYIHDYSPCQTSAFLTDDYFGVLLGTGHYYEQHMLYPGQSTIACIAETDSYTFDPAPENLPINTATYALRPSLTNNADSIYGIAIHLSDGHFNSPCKWLSSNQAGTPGYDVALSPNPAASILTITTPSESIESVYLYNQTGQFVQRMEGNQSQEVTIDVSAQPPGIYIAHVFGQHRRQRVIKWAKM
jgi:Secretion system C-terminal sorting domain